MFTFLLMSTISAAFMSTMWSSESGVDMFIKLYWIALTAYGLFLIAVDLGYVVKV